MLLTATSRQRVYQFRHERKGGRRDIAPGRINGADVTNQWLADKARGRRYYGPRECRTGLPAARRFRQHLLDFDRDPVAIDQHHATGDRQVVGEHLDLVRFRRVEFDDGAAGKPHYLMDGHGGGSEDHHEIDGDFIEGWHFNTAALGLKNCWFRDHHVMVS
jgi:hypothetical protein